MRTLQCSLNLTSNNEKTGSECEEISGIEKTATKMVKIQSHRLDLLDGTDDEKRVNIQRLEEYSTNFTKSLSNDWMEKGGTYRFLSF